MTIYTPRGDGHCAECGRDVSHHIDKAHKFVQCCFGESTAHMCDAVVHVSINGKETRCTAVENDAVHDVGRVLTCPEEAGDD